MISGGTERTDRTVHVSRGGWVEAGSVAGAHLEPMWSMDGASLEGGLEVLRGWLGYLKRAACLSAVAGCVAL